MRTRPARLDSTNRLRLPTSRETATTASPATQRWGRGVAIAMMAALGAIGSAAPVAAEERAWDWTVPQQIASKGVDLAIVRPLSAARAGVGAILLVPATILASPGCAVNLITGADCRPIFEVPYEVLVAEPAEYAFERKLGEL